MNIPGSAGLYKIFYVVTGAGFLTLMFGFGQCLFDLDQVGACVDHAEYATDVLKSFGDHMIQWLIAVMDEIFDRNEILP